MRKKSLTRRHGASRWRSGSSKRTPPRKALIVAGKRAADLRQEAARLRTEVTNLRQNSAQVRSELNTLAQAAEHATAQVAYMAEHDFLTGLPNRSLLNDRLAQSIAVAHRHSKKVAVLSLDLDHFKHINDSLGHAVGDQLLLSAARRLKECVRHSDTVSRQGGDEFIVLLTEIETLHDATSSAEKLIEAMARPHLIGGHRLHITLSIGISLCPDDGRDIPTLLRDADTAMYHAKEKGRNNPQVFRPEMSHEAVARRSVEDALRHALERHGLVLHYQPKVNLETGVITGAEALVRLQPPNQPLMYPTAFVSVAENCGLIQPLGKWVLGEACRQTAEWLQAGIEIGQVAVNVSAVELHGKNFLAGVRNALDAAGLDPHHLELELTESGLMHDTEQTTELLFALKDLGVHIAIDDFGTGYSSLSYLRRFPIDTLKIDQSFVRDINGTGDADADEAIVSAVIAMGRGLNQRVIAEGVETPEQLAFLQSRQCAEGQGYYFSRPVAADEFAALLGSPRKTGKNRPPSHLLRP